MLSACNDHKILESSEEQYVVHENIEKLEIIYEIVQKKSENMMSDKICTIFWVQNLYFMKWRVICISIYCVVESKKL